MSIYLHGTINIIGRDVGLEECIIEHGYEDARVLSYLQPISAIIYHKQLLAFPFEDSEH